MSVYCRVCLTIKGKHISWFIVENKEEFLIYLRDLYSLYFTNIFLGRGEGSCSPIFSFLCINCGILLSVLQFIELVSSNSSYKYIGYMFTIIP